MKLEDLSLIKVTPPKDAKLPLRLLCGLVSGFCWAVSIMFLGYLLELGMQLARDCP